MGQKNSKNTILKNSNLLKLKISLLKRIFSSIPEKERLKNFLRLNKRIKKIILVEIKTILINGEKDNKFSLEYIKNIPNCEILKIIHPKKIDEKDLKCISDAKHRNFKEIYFYKIPLFMGLSFLIESYLSNLKTLHLENCNLNFFSIKYLSGLNLPSLLNLNLNFNQIGIEGLGFLVKSKFPKLQMLELRKNLIGLNNKNIVDENDGDYDNKNFGEDIDFRAHYFSHFNFQELTVLDLSQNNLRNLEIIYLSLANLPNLININLHDNDIKKFGIYHFCKSNFTKFKMINLKNNSLIHLSIRHLPSSFKNFPNLEILCLDGNSIEGR
jgi:hypothetical protein